MLHFHFEPIVWRLVPLSTPRIRRHCPGCGEERPFASTDRFRLNAHKRRIDAWLLYRCTVCDATWKRTLLERVPQDAIDRERFERMTRNDPGAARDAAFDLAGLPGIQVDADVPFQVARLDGDLARARRDGLAVLIRIEMLRPCRVRLDRLLCTELGLSRSRLEAHDERGEIEVRPISPRGLRRQVSHGLLVHLAPQVTRR